MVGSEQTSGMNEESPQKVILDETLNIDNSDLKTELQDKIICQISSLDDEKSETGVEEEVYQFRIVKLHS